LYRQKKRLPSRRPFVQQGQAAASSDQFMVPPPNRLMPTGSSAIQKTTAGELVQSVPMQDIGQTRQQFWGVQYPQPSAPHDMKMNASQAQGYIQTPQGAYSFPGSVAPTSVSDYGSYYSASGPTMMGDDSSKGALADTSVVQDQQFSQVLHEIDD
jgi:hypothetical protein